jgi:hypothetical protein
MSSAPREGQQCRNVFFRHQGKGKDGWQPFLIVPAMTAIFSKHLNSGQILFLYHCQWSVHVKSQETLLESFQEISITQQQSLTPEELHRTHRTLDNSLELWWELLLNFSFNSSKNK